MGLIHFPKVLHLSLLACVSYRRKEKVKIVSIPSVTQLINGPKGNYRSTVGKVIGVK